VNPGRTILMTEFLNDWKSIGTPNSSGTISKSHRPINPFYHVGSGFDEYGAPLQNRGFIYGVPQDQVYYGLLRTAHLAHRTNLINGAQTGVSPVNAVGRHHPTKYSAYERDYGGSANFLMCDGHVESMTVLQSLQQRKWGDRYYSLTGENQILNFDTLD